MDITNVCLFIWFTSQNFRTRV